jgi:hypothetical protein
LLAVVGLGVVLARMVVEKASWIVELSGIETKLD